MEAQEIAVFIKYFNAVLTEALVIFAVFGIVAAVRRRSRLNIFRNRVFLQAFCVAALAAFALEVTVFNFQHYLKYFAGPELFTTEVSAEAPGRLLTNKAGYSAEMVAEGGLAGIHFRGLDMNLTSVFAEVNFGDFRMCEASVSWTDEESTRGFAKTLYRGLPHENWITVQPHGKVSEFKVLFGARGSGKGGIDVVQVALNRPIPFYFSGLRLLAVSLLIFAAFTFFSGRLRAKASFLLFEYRFDPASGKQALAYASTVILLILFSWVSVYTSRYNKSSQDETIWQLYNKYLTDAIIAGSVWLDVEISDKMLTAERPYDPAYRKANGYVDGVDYIWDWAWYKGKYYCYFGPVPALILYVPYTLATGKYLSNQAGIFLFAAAAIVLLAALWRYCVRRWMPDARFAFFLLSFITLYFASGYYTVLTMVRHYSIVQSAGFTFAIAGILLLLKSVEREKTNHLILFLACLCLALVVGCRPNMIFVSLIVPVVLWRRWSWKLLLSVLTPYLLVAIPLCMYNYVRFNSIFFGGHSLTFVNVEMLNQINPIGYALRAFTHLTYDLFLPGMYSLEFPYVKSVQYHHDELYTLGFLNASGGCSGLINFPSVYCLFYLFKIKNMNDNNRLSAFKMACIFLIIGASIMTVNALLTMHSGRYMLDFSTFIILASLFCAYFWGVCPKSELSGKVRLKVTYTLLAASVVVGLFLFVTGGMNGIRDLTMYRYLEYSLGFVR